MRLLTPLRMVPFHIQAVVLGESRHGYGLSPAAGIVRRLLEETGERTETAFAGERGLRVRTSVRGTPAAYFDAGLDLFRR